VCERVSHGGISPSHRLLAAECVNTQSVREKERKGPSLLSSMLRTVRWCAGVYVYRVCVHVCVNGRDREFVGIETER